MKKCYYCNSEGLYYNPILERFYCEKHANKKMNDYINELKYYSCNTLKDWFDVCLPVNKKLRNCSLNTKTGKIIYLDDEGDK